MASTIDIKKSISAIFAHHGLGAVKSVKKIPAGFTNTVYLVNDQYILKSCSDVANESSFKQEIYFYKLFEGKMPVPRVLVSDESKALLPSVYMVYKKIDGDNLFNIWHKVTDEQRANFVRQICDMLRIINSEPVNEEINWYKQKMDSMTELLNTMQSRKILTAELLKDLRVFVDTHHNVLKTQKLGLTYWDMHFDNVLVRDAKVVGLLDFEGVEVMSIDYGLDTVRRLTNYPQIYASEHGEKKIVAKDYTKIYDWFKEFYPELFAFDHIERRVDLYAIEYDLRLLLRFPDSDGLKSRLAETLAKDK